jgi:histone-lysine N-methyltransferase SETMAR
MDFACLLHDNAPAHTAAVAKDAVKECGFEEIEHPPYSPDLAPTDYYFLLSIVQTTSNIAT